MNQRIITSIGESDLTVEDFETYCLYMQESFEIIQKNKIAFFKERSIEDHLKLYLLQELFDFFFLEDEIEKCEEINEWLNCMQMQKWIRSGIYKR
jgi:hypothetical protein